MEKVKELSVKDSAFRKICLENPNEAIKKVTGKEVPAGIVLKFIENEGAHLTVVLPDAPVSGELSDSDLGSVAGGISIQSSNPNQTDPVQQKPWY
jgi:hypothetical protein